MSKAMKKAMKKKDSHVQQEQRQFTSILPKMEKRYGRLSQLDDLEHVNHIFCIEGNMLKIHRTYPEANSRRVLEAIPLALYTIQDYLTGNETPTDMSAHENEANLRLKHAILSSFDPMTSPDVEQAFQTSMPNCPRDLPFWNQYFRVPVRSLCRIHQSVKTWIEMLGPDGYFINIERSIGEHVKRDTQMNYTIQTFGEYMPEEMFEQLFREGKLQRFE